MWWGIAGFKRCCDRGCTTNVKKTSKNLQIDYETVYTGSIIEFESRFSVLIAMVFVIMTFSSAIPAIYFAGFLLCFTSYWSDKIMFIKYWKIPPRHGSILANQAR